MTTEDYLVKITNQISDFNETNEKFIIELFITKKQTTKRMSFDQIMKKVCDEFKLTPEYLCMRTRELHICIPRQMCHYMANKHSKGSLSEIGFYFGNKDHSTALNSYRKIKARLETDKDFRDKYYYFLNPIE